MDSLGSVLMERVKMGELWLFSSVERTHSRQGPIFTREPEVCAHQLLLFITDPDTLSKTEWELPAMLCLPSLATNGRAPGSLVLIFAGLLGYS